MPAGLLSKAAGVEDAANSGNPLEESHGGAAHRGLVDQVDVSCPHRLDDLKARFVADGFPPSAGSWGQPGPGKHRFFSPRARTLSLPKSAMLVPRAGIASAARLMPPAHSRANMAMESGEKSFHFAVDRFEEGHVFSVQFFPVMVRTEATVF